MEEGISGPTKVDDVDLQAAGLDEVVPQRHEVQVVTLDGNVDVRFGTRLPACPRAEEQREAYVLTVREGAAKCVDGTHGASIDASGGATTLGQRTPAPKGSAVGTRPRQSASNGERGPSNGERGWTSASRFNIRSSATVRS